MKTLAGEPAGTVSPDFSIGSRSFDGSKADRPPRAQAETSPDLTLQEVALVLDERLQLAVRLAAARVTRRVPLAGLFGEQNLISVRGDDVRLDQLL